VGYGDTLLNPLVPDDLKELLTDAGFAKVEVQTVEQEIAFPSVLDYVRFQLLRHRCRPYGVIVPRLIVRRPSRQSPQRPQIFLIPRCCKAAGSPSDSRHM
jgi:hypothetical protein